MTHDKFEEAKKLEAEIKATGTFIDILEQMLEELKDAQTYGEMFFAPVFRYDMDEMQLESLIRVVESTSEEIAEHEESLETKFESL